MKNENEEEDQKILGCDGIITGCSGAIVGAIVMPFLIGARWKPAGGFGPIIGVIFLLFVAGIGALIGGFGGNILNRLIKRIKKR